MNTQNNSKSNTASGTNSKSSNSQNKNRNRKRSNTNRRKRSNTAGPKLSPLDKAYRNYLNLLEKHLLARRKYFDLFHRADPNQLAKLERNFYGALTTLREFEDNIKDDIKEEFFKKVNGLKLDDTYSSNHAIDPQHIDVAPNPEEQPHYLASQRESFSEDTEETKGSIEDYYAYKGIAPPVIDTKNNE